jgi:hypothetical protein
MAVVPVALPLLAAISALRISVPADLRPLEARRAVLLSLQEVSWSPAAGASPAAWLHGGLSVVPLPAWLAAHVCARVRARRWLVDARPLFAAGHPGDALEPVANAAHLLVPAPCPLPLR